MTEWLPINGFRAHFEHIVLMMAPGAGQDGYLLSDLTREREVRGALPGLAALGLIRIEPGRTENTDRIFITPAGLERSAEGANP